MTEKNQSKKKISKKVIIGIVVIVVLAIAFVAIKALPSSTPKTPEITESTTPVKTSTVTIKDMEITTSLTGRIQPIEEASILPLISGKVTVINVDLGYKVSKGTVLFEIDKDQLQNSYDQALAGYNQAKISFDNAKINFERNANLYSEGAISKIQYEQTEMLYNTALQGLNQGTTGLNSAKDAFDNHQITSPIDGYVTSVNINVGELASQGMASMTIANIEKVEIETSVSEQLINKINISDNVKVKITSISDSLFDGTITALSPAPAKNTLTYPLKVSLNNQDSLIKSGMFAEIVIVSEKRDNVVAIPSDATLVKTGKTVVVTINEDNTVNFIPVSLGIDNGEYVEITEGLSNGDVIVVEGQQYLNDDSKVNIVE